MYNRIFAHPGLHNVISRLKADYPPLENVEYLPSRQSDAQLFLARRTAPVLVLDGTDVLPEENNTLFHTPNVHNAAALLLGSNDAYRALLDRYQGGVAFSFPGELKVRYFCPREDCSVLCKLTDVELGISEAPGAAQELAALLGLDLIELPTDYTLLQQILA